MTQGRKGCSKKRTPTDILEQQPSMPEQAEKVQHKHCQLQSYEASLIFFAFRNNIFVFD